LYVIASVERALSKDRTGIVIPPPLLFAVPLLAGWIAGQWWEWRLLPNRTATIFVGAAFILAGVAIALAGVRRFRAAHTTVLPFGGTTRIVTSGIYRWTRNPMYLGMAVAYTGVAILLNSGWSLVLLPVALGLVYLLAIRREERYLTEKFGDVYRQYCATAPRWI
jgi:protein-S-isoprenylcysteine O-methyltransferase Ste14